MPVTRRVEICNQKGLHARASAAFSRTAQEFEAAIVVMRAGMEADGKSIIELLSLGAGIGCEIEITADGVDAEPAVTALMDLVNNRFGEPN
ncbi:HPr family phosphocarrier protein [Ponticaulis sp.]|uniref:HPr family phosphocarrier protein n=1 Tax=Ponticaulis sp. TaxID=2020902 RepID=UPI000B67FBD5|nr:HPr family phosphocarrier protein [Ponticaulis sp.]MAI89843.1 HPr family phosphocarrier protein [Ponticaulis sp.]OUX99518.1 MAG: HPr family phosphocarrier protein [Hyphomonadaceae bacterium TMED5]|tara:strand:+ start:75604 stop:75876 length:273 start_codon:yes stop_codon:yes gene_type:complete